MTLWMVRAESWEEYEKKFQEDNETYLTMNDSKHNLSSIKDKSHLLKILNTVYPNLIVNKTGIEKFFNNYRMKKIILLMVVLILNTLVYSQPFGESISAYQIIELQYKNSSGEVGTTFFRYNNQNKLIKALWMLEDNSRYSTNFYEHDASGNLVSAFRDFSDGLTSYESFNYDTAGNKISEFFYRSDSITGSATYTYNGKQLNKASFNNYKGWLSGELELEFNNKNQKEKGVLLYDGKILCEISYDYDSNGNLIKEFWDFNGKWNQTFRYIYAKKKQIKNFYSSPFLSVEGNYRISKEEYTYNDEIGGPSLYFYNENGLLVKKVFIRDDSLTTNTFYEYDNNGKLVSSKRFYSDGNIANFIYNYDQYNNLIRRNLRKRGNRILYELFCFFCKCICVRSTLTYPHCS